MPKPAQDQERTVDKLQEQELWSKVNSLLGQHMAAEPALKLKLRQSMGLVLQIGEILSELKQRWRKIKRSDRPKWEDVVGAQCDVQLREAQRYMRIYVRRDLLDTLCPDWREELTLTRASTLLSEYFGSATDDEDDETSQKEDEEEDATDEEDDESQDGETEDTSNQTDEEDSKSSQDDGKSNDDTRSDSGSGYADLINVARSSLSKVKSRIAKTLDRQILSSIKSDLDGMRSECELRIKQCDRRIRLLNTLVAETPRESAGNDQKTRETSKRKCKNRGMAKTRSKTASRLAEFSATA